MLRPAPRRGPNAPGRCGGRDRAGAETARRRRRPRCAVSGRSVRRGRSPPRRSRCPPSSNARPEPSSQPVLRTAPRATTTTSAGDDACRRRGARAPPGRCRHPPGPLDLDAAADGDAAAVVHRLHHGAEMLAEHRAPAGSGRSPPGSRGRSRVRHEAATSQPMKPPPMTSTWAGPAARSRRRACGIVAAAQGDARPRAAPRAGFGQARARGTGGDRAGGRRATPRRSRGVTSAGSRSRPVAGSPRRQSASRSTRFGRVVASAATSPVSTRLREGRPVVGAMGLGADDRQRTAEARLPQALGAAQAGERGPHHDDPRLGVAHRGAGPGILDADGLDRAGDPRALDVGAGARPRGPDRSGGPRGPSGRSGRGAA